jgi:hypothetical protein
VKIDLDAQPAPLGWSGRRRGAPDCLCCHTRVHTAGMHVRSRQRRKKQGTGHAACQCAPDRGVSYLAGDQSHPRWRVHRRNNGGNDVSTSRRGAGNGYRASLAGITPASAAQVSTAPGPQLVCSVAGGTTGAGRCGTTTHSPTNSYLVKFTLTGSVSASDVTGWTVPSQNVSSSGPGCTAGQLQCWVAVSSTDVDPVSVTVTVSFRFLQSIFLAQRAATVTVLGRCPVAC